MTECLSEESAMTNEDPYGSACSGWAVFVAAIFVGTILAWVASHQGAETNPAPGPADDGIRSGRGAAQN